MKHFMTWWENEPTDFYLWSQYKLMKFAWRAALKWVLRKVEQSNSDGSIIQYIKDELGEN